MVRELRGQAKVRNEHLAFRLGTEQQGDDEHQGGADGRDQHRHGETEWLGGSEQGEQRPGEAPQIAPWW